MLTTLRVRNLALVADLAIEFPPGFVAITGETGAGKSIVLGALKLLLGERADRTLIRAGADACTVEAGFDVRRLRAPLAAWLAENGLEPCEDHQLRLKRTVTVAGQNRQFINGTATGLSVLSAVGEWLVDMHGPHDHQSLLQPVRQLALLDAFAGVAETVAALGGQLQARSALVGEKAALGVDDRRYAQELDLLRFQVGEIEAARLDAGEEAGLLAEHQRAGNAARLLQLGQVALELAAEDEGSVAARSAAVGRAVQEMQRLDPAASALSELHGQAAEAWREFQSAVARYLDSVEVDPERLTVLTERLNLLQDLKRKYGGTVADVIAFGAEARGQRERLAGRDAELARINAELARVDAESVRIGRELSRRRQAAIPKLAAAVARHLTDLGFRQSRFDVALTSRLAGSEDDRGTPTATGWDSVEFQFAPNPGEPARPLRAIASSGEMARVMLAIKTVLAVEDEVPVLVFDEVDANVGGETANAVGLKMRQIARQRQVLCITHLAQVAAAAAAHFVVTKQVEGGRTTTAMALLDEPERVTELARMLGGQSEAARRHAAALLRG